MNDEIVNEGSLLVKAIDLATALSFNAFETGNSRLAGAWMRLANAYRTFDEERRAAYAVILEEAESGEDC